MQDDKNEKPCVLAPERVPEKSPHLRAELLQRLRHAAPEAFAEGRLDLDRLKALVGDADPGAAVQDAINIHGFDEVIISTLSQRVSRWLKLDLPSKVAGMGLPVTTVTPGEADREPAGTATAAR